MDATGCPEGYATDVGFQLRTETEPCNTPVAAFWSVLLFLMVVRFAAAIRQAMTWHHQNVKLDRKHRKPFAVTLSFAVATFQLVTIICIGLNVANVYNGLSWMLVSLSMLPFFIQSSFIMLRMVRLGERIIPLGRQLGVGSEEGRRSLRRFSNGGRFLAFWRFISATVSSITFMILTPIDPSHQDLDGTIGLVFKALFMFTATAGLLYQLHRCVLVVKRMQRNMQEMNISSSRDAFAKTQSSIRSMHGRMLIGFLVGVPTTMGFVCTAFHITPRNVWWVVLYPTAAEVFMAAALEFVAMPKRTRTEPRSTEERGNVDQVKITSSSGNKVQPGIPSPSVLVAAARPPPEVGETEETIT